MRRQRVVPIAAGAVLAFVLIVTASSGSVEFARRSPSVPWSITPLEVEPTATDDEIERTDIDESATDDGETGSSEIFVIILFGLTMLAVAAFVSARRRPTARRIGRRRRDAFDVVDDRLDDIAAAVRGDASTQRAILVGGEPRNAIVECWCRVESLLVDAGFERRASDTSTDLVVRTLGRADVDHGALEALAERYREARYSTHPIGEPERDAALAALTALHAGLGVRPGREIEPSTEPVDLP